MEQGNGGRLLMGTVGGMGILAFSAGASTVHCPITKGPGRGCYSERKSGVGSTVLGPVNEAGETAKLSGRTLGKIYNQLVKAQCKDLRGLAGMKPLP